MKTKTDRNKNMRKLHAMLNETGYMKHKASLLSGYGVEHASDLDDTQLEHLVQRVIDMKTEAETHIRKKRSAVLTILQKLGIYNNNNDWSDVNKYLSNPRIAGKLLPEMTGLELDNLVIKLNSILSKKGKKDKEINRLAANN